MNDLHHSALFQRLASFANDLYHGVLPQKAASVITYALSGSLVVGDTMDWLNHNASAMGVLIGLATFATNFYFHVKNSRKKVLDHDPLHK